MPDSRDIDDAIDSITHIPYYDLALKQIIKKTLDNMVHAILSSNINDKESQEKLILDKARYEGAKLALDNMIISLEKESKNGK